MFQPRKLSSAEMKTAVDNKFSILSLSLSISLSLSLSHSLSFTLSISLTFLIFLTQLSNSYCRATCWWSTLARVHCFSKAPCYTCLRSTFRNFDHYASCKGCLLDVCHYKRVSTGKRPLTKNKKNFLLTTQRVPSTLMSICSKGPMGKSQASGYELVTFRPTQSINFF